MPSKAIERGAKIVRNLAKPCTPLQGRRDTLTNAIHVLSSLRIELRLDNLVLGFLDESLLRLPIRLELTFCTLDLEARAIKWMHDDYTQRMLALC